MGQNSRRRYKVRITYKDLSNPWKTRRRTTMIETHVVVGDHGELMHDETLKKVETVLKVYSHNEKLLITGMTVDGFSMPFTD